MAGSRHNAFVRAHMAARHGMEFDAMDEQQMGQYGEVDSMIEDIHDEKHDWGYDVDHTHGSHGEVKRLPAGTP